MIADYLFGIVFERMRRKEEETEKIVYRVVGNESSGLRDLAVIVWV